MRRSRTTTSGIHVDAERAKRESPFGATIARGNLTLSIIDGPREQLSSKDTSDLEHVVLGVKMGWNRVRFPAPVLSPGKGACVRAPADSASLPVVAGVRHRSHLLT